MHIKCWYFEIQKIKDNSENFPAIEHVLHLIYTHVGTNSISHLNENFNEFDLVRNEMSRHEVNATARRKNSIKLHFHINKYTSF